MPADSLSARHLRSDCCLYRPGHLVHWIQADHARRDDEHRPEPGHLVSVSVDGLVVIDVDGEVRRLWNHDPLRLAANAAEHHGRVLHQPRWGLLSTPSDPDGSTAWFCVVHDDHPDRCPCATAVPGATVLDRLLSAGGGIIGRDEVLALVDGLDHGTGEPPGRPAPDS